MVYESEHTHFSVLFLASDGAAAEAAALVELNRAR